MERQRRAARIWPYLPTFRAVAELEHITKAAAALGISPSAVSRTITLLEASVGRSLFVRAQRRIVLNEAGARFLRATRTAVRVMDDGLSEVDDSTFAGAVRVASVEPFTSTLAMPAFERLRETHPRLVPSLLRVSETDVPRLLSTGAIDVAFVRHVREDASLSSSVLSSFPTAGFASPNRAADRNRLGARDSVFRCVDVAAAKGATGVWPHGIRRVAELIVPDYDVALSACLASSLAAVLPIEMARVGEESGRLVRLPGILSAPIAIHVVTREMVALPGRAEAVVDAARFVAPAEHAHEKTGGRQLQRSSIRRTGDKRRGIPG